MHFSEIFYGKSSMQAYTNIMTSYFLGAIYIAIHSAIEIVRNVSWKKWAELRLDDEIVYYYYYSIPITWCKSKPTRYGITHSMIYKVNLWYSCICECANAPFVAYANECSMKFSLLTILNQWNIRCIHHLTVNLRFVVFCRRVVYDGNAWHRKRNNMICIPNAGAGANHIKWIGAYSCTNVYVRAREMKDFISNMFRAYWW